jgi:hypothetical protein
MKRYITIFYRDDYHTPLLYLYKNIPIKNRKYTQEQIRTFLLGDYYSSWAIEHALLK